MNKSDSTFGTITAPSLLVFQFKNQRRRSGRFWIKSVESCFPNCQISYEDLYLPDHDVFPFKMFHSHSSQPSSFYSSSLFSSFFLSFFFCFGLHLHIIIQVMGMAAEAQFHVLAVDDSLIDRMLIERLLKTSSFHVTAVDSGSKALKFLGLVEDEQRNEEPPSVAPETHQDVEVNLIITDYCMPGITGYDLLRKIKESKSLKDIPVVIMSSENVPSRINRCLEEGAEEFFLKPVQQSDVNKLRPHLLKSKVKEEEDQLINKRKDMEESHCQDKTRPKMKPLKAVPVKIDDT